MRTIDEVNADLEALRVRNADEMDKALQRCSAILAKKMVGNVGWESWLAKQFQGHLEVVFQFSKQEPIPIEATFNALMGNVCIADLIVEVKWENCADFKAVADDMLQHFKDVITLKMEVEEIRKASQPDVSASAMSQMSNTIH